MRRSDTEIVELIRSKGGDVWVDAHPEVLVDPTVIDADLPGYMHRSCNANLMPFDVVKFDGRTLYLFDHHLETLT